MTEKDTAAAKSKDGRRLTQKQEAFCLAYLEIGNASGAYRQAYSTSRMAEATVNRNAHELLKGSKIAARLEDLRAPVRERAVLTFESHLKRLNDLSLASEAEGQYSAAITAETNRGRAAGLYIEKHDHRSGDGSMSPKGRTLEDFYEDSGVPVKSRTP